MEIMNYLTVGMALLMIFTGVIALCELFCLDEDDAMRYVNKTIGNNVFLFHLLVPCYLTYRIWSVQVICRFFAIASIILMLYVPYELLHNHMVMWDLPYVISYVLTLMCLIICVLVWIFAIKVLIVLVCNLTDIVCCLFDWILSLDEKKFQKKTEDIKKQTE